MTKRRLDHVDTDQNKEKECAIYGWRKCGQKGSWTTSKKEDSIAVQDGKLRALDLFLQHVVEEPFIRRLWLWWRGGI